MATSASSPLVLVGDAIADNAHLGFPDFAINLLRDSGCHIIWDKEAEADPDILQRVEGVLIFATTPRSFFKHPPETFKSLKIISNCGVGVNHLQLDEWRRLGVAIANTPDVVSNATAEVAVALLLASARNIVTGANLAKSTDWKEKNINWLGVDVTGKALGIVGMGKIGTKFAQRMKAFEMKIWYHNRNRKPAEEEAEVGDAIYCESLDELCRQSDFVVLCCPLTESTRGLFGERQFRQMKTNGTLINVSRGEVVDQEALLDALTSRRIRAAALDVTYPEPLPRDHPLLSLANVVITPHIGTATQETRSRMWEMSVRNLVAGVRGEDVPYQVV